MNKKIRKAIHAAGMILEQGFYKIQQYDEKERLHLRSEYDLKIDLYLKHFLESEYPEDSIFSEESSEQKKSSKTRWILDPIDGTSYFIFGEPFFSISMAKEVSNKIVEAHVFNPITKEYFYTEESIDKSNLNNSEIRVSDVSKLKDSFLAFGFSAHPQKIKLYLDNWSFEMESCKKALPWIGPALSICNVARGRVEGFIDYGCSMEGQAAASFILHNAGGVSLNIDGSSFDYETKGGIFSNRKLNLLEGRSG
ncbi:MAG: hypothetical protein PF447_15045 [Spirochaetaceae bacterium]|jgi:myo-inositol-1(or 4)-monophosphatase|nr:hypothetical protein [Spirochaetaceae bacterium]